FVNDPALPRRVHADACVVIGHDDPASAVGTSVARLVAGDAFDRNAVLADTGLGGDVLAVHLGEASVEVRESVAPADGIVFELASGRSAGALAQHIDRTTSELPAIEGGPAAIVRRANGTQAAGASARARGSPAVHRSRGSTHPD